MFGTRLVNPAVWAKGKRTITGCWEYYWPTDCFDIWLDKYDPATGMRKHVQVTGDTPEWGDWKLVVRATELPADAPS